MYFKAGFPLATTLRSMWVPELQSLAGMVKDLSLNLDSLQRFRRILP